MGKSQSKSYFLLNGFIIQKPEKYTITSFQIDDLIFQEEHLVKSEKVVKPLNFGRRFQIPITSKIILKYHNNSKKRRVNFTAETIVSIDSGQFKVRIGSFQLDIIGLYDFQ